jgi:hypothetical protein
MDTPNGYEQIVATFGDVESFVDETGILRPTWQVQYLSIADLPFKIPLAWNTRVQISRITCHKLMVEKFEQIFQEIFLQGLSAKITSYGGCFNFRQQRTGPQLSTHAWGIAVDLDVATNEQGTTGDIDQRVVGIFRGAGFEWGGDWFGKVKDPMHFQFATGY